MTKWKHVCSMDWMKARQQCLTATDVKDLLPITKTGRKRVIGDEQYLKVLSRKLVNIEEDDCISTGAAARGHILEPYAIDRYNEEDFGGNEWLWHWDDIVITRQNHVYGGLAFSPDAMDHDPKNIKTNMIAITGIKTIGEVKSYSAENHLARAYTPKDELEERWQLATAMAVCEDIQTAYLMFYNPSMRTQLYIADFNRSDLQDEIDMILDVEEKWLAWLGDFGKLDHFYCVTGQPNEEQAIIRSIMKREELNPEWQKSVMK